MTSLSAAWFVILCMIAVSYGWAMRGTILGHERGGMLPMAMLGLLFALNMPITPENLCLLPAVGAAGGYVGGVISIGQTFGFAANGHGRDLRRGFLGLALKGSEWLGIPGGWLGIALSMLTGGSYGFIDVCIIVAALPLLRFAGDRLLNRPHEIKSADIRPKLYFSVNRKEKWGGPVLYTVFLLVYAICKSDAAAITMTAAGMLAGAIGWPLSACFMRFATLSKAKWVVKLRKGNMIDTIKVKEFTFGLFIGLFMSCGFLLCRGSFGSGTELAQTAFTQYADVLTAVWLCLFALFELLHYFAWRRPATAAEIDEWENLGLIAVDYANCERRRSKEAGGGAPLTLWRKLLWKYELRFENALWCYIPLVLALGGGAFASRALAGAVLIWALGYESIYYNMNPYTPLRRPRAWTAALAAASLAALAEAVFGQTPPLLLWAGCYIGIYMVVMLACYFGDFKSRVGRLGSARAAVKDYANAVPVGAVFVLESAALLIAGIIG